MTSKANTTLICPPQVLAFEKPASRCDLCSVLNYTVCGGLSAEELTQFGAATKPVYLAEGGRLLYEGDIDRLVFTVTSGCLKSYKQLADGRRQITGFYFPGDFIRLVQSDKYLADVEAVTDSGVCQMQRSDLNILSKDIPNIEHRLYDLTSDALAKLQGQIILLGRKNAKERVATFILMLSKRAFERGVVSNPVNLPMNREDIADFLGVTTETVSRTFSALRKLNIIGPDVDRTVKIIDRKELERIAEGP